MIGAAVVIAAVTLFLPDGELSKFVRLLSSLALLCTIALPAVDFFRPDNIDELFGSLTEGIEDDLGAEDKYYDILTELGCDELEARLTELVCEKFGIAEGDIEIGIEAEESDGSFCPRRVTVGLFGAAVLKDPYEIEEFIEPLLACDCDVYY